MKTVRRPRVYKQGARADAALATGRAIVEAFVDRLLRQWYDEITLDAVARDAGVTVQTVVRRFGGKEGLLGEAARMLTLQINRRRGAPGGDVDRAIESLVRDYEQVGDSVLRLLALEPRHRALRSLLDHGRGQHRVWVMAMAGVRLDRLESGARTDAIDELVIVTDVYAWKLLRRDMGRTVAGATEAMQNMVAAVLERGTGKRGAQR